MQDLVACLHLASPVISIRVKNKIHIIRESKVEYEQEGQDREDGQKLQAHNSSRSLMIRRKR